MGPKVDEVMLPENWHGNGDPGTRDNAPLLGSIVKPEIVEPYAFIA